MGVDSVTQRNRLPSDEQVLDVGHQVIDMLIKRKGKYLGLIYQTDGTMGCSGPCKTPEAMAERNECYQPDYPGFVVDIEWKEEEVYYELVKWLEKVSPFKETPALIPSGMRAARGAIEERLERITQPYARELADKWIADARKTAAEEGEG